MTAIDEEAFEPPTLQDPEPCTSTVLCWACGVLVQVPIVNNAPSLVFRCGWCGAVSEAAPDATGAQHHRHRGRRRGPWRTIMRLLSRLSYIVVLVVLALITSIVAPGVGLVLPRIATTPSYWLLHTTISYLLTVGVLFNYLAATFTSPGTIIECCENIPAAFRRRSAAVASMSGRASANVNSSSSSGNISSSSSSGNISSSSSSHFGGDQGAGKNTGCNMRTDGGKCQDPACSSAADKHDYSAADVELGAVGDGGGEDSGEVSSRLQDTSTASGGGGGGGDGGGGSSHSGTADTQCPPAPSTAQAVASEGGSGGGCFASASASAASAAPSPPSPSPPAPTPPSTAAPPLQSSSAAFVPQYSYTHLRYCWACRGPQTQGSHHCYVCGKCVVDQDHHCPFIANCVGRANLRNFISFLGFTVTSMLYTSAMSAVLLVRHRADAEEALGIAAVTAQRSRAAAAVAATAATASGDGGDGPSWLWRRLESLTASTETLVTYILTLVAQAPLHITAAAYILIMSLAILGAVGLLLFQTVRHVVRMAEGVNPTATERVLRHHVHPASDAAVVVSEQSRRVVWAATLRSLRQVMYGSSSGSSDGGFWMWVWPMWGPPPGVLLPPPPSPLPASASRAVDDADAVSATAAAAARVAGVLLDLLSPLIRRKAKTH